jgi:hypothetical protein
VYARIPALRGCYEGRLAEVPDLQGRISLEAEVDAERVRGAGVSGSDIADPALERCLVSGMRMWRLPDEVQGKVGVTLSFTPGE